MRFSIWPAAAQPWPQVHEVAAAADRDFWHCLYVADHFMGDGDRGAHVLEGTAVLAALALGTTRIRLANLVLSMTYRHPAVVANWAATTDHVCGGRLALGVGAGWQLNEHRQYGLRLGPPRERVDRFEEGLRVVRGLLGQDRTTEAGHHYQLADAVCEPKPVQSPLPLLVGGSGPRMLGLVARYAQQWNHWSHPDGYAATAARLDAACEKAGRDPATVWRSTQALTIPTATAEERARAAETARTAGQPVIFGSPAQLAEQMAQWRDAGVDEVIVPDRALPAGPAKFDAMAALQEALTPLT